LYVFDASGATRYSLISARCAEVLTPGLSDHLSVVIAGINRFQRDEINQMKSNPPAGGDPPAKPRRRLNADQRKALKAARLAIYLREVGRKAQRRMEPNDRRDTYGLGEKIRSISPEEMDRLLRDDEE
jgi:hypothetical protein